MDNTTMWSNQLKVRNACQECHTRKIKCIMPAEGGSCQACKSSARTCYFLPRQKCGRVPQKESERRGHAAKPTPTALSDTSRSPPTTYISSNMSNDFSAMDTTSSSTAYSILGPGFLTPVEQTSDMSLFTRQLTFPFSDPADERYSTSSNHGSRASSTVSSHEATRVVLAKSFASLQNPDWQTAPSQLKPSTIPQEHQKLFTQLLKDCHNMQMQNAALLQTAPGMDSMRATLQSAILSVDTVCHGVLEVAGNDSILDAESKTPPESKLMAMTMAAAFAVFEICEALAGSSLSASLSLDYTLMWKRLDLNLTQVRVALQRLLQFNGSFTGIIRQAISRAKVLDNRIKSTIQEGYSDWDDGL